MFFLFFLAKNNNRKLYILNTLQNRPSCEAGVIVEIVVLLFITICETLQWWKTQWHVPFIIQILFGYFSIDGYFWINQFNPCL